MATLRLRRTLAATVVQFAGLGRHVAQSGQKLGVLGQQCIQPAAQVCALFPRLGGSLQGPVAIGQVVIHLLLVPGDARLQGLLDFLLSLPGIGGNSLSTSHLGRFLVFVYIWLPFMILPIQAALERLPPTLLQASADLGAHPRQTFFQVILPLSIPGIAAGSIFTFSLTLGDFIVPQLVGPPGYFIGSMVYAQQGAIGNMPMAAAFTLVPIVLIAIYLSIVKRLGAFDAL